MFTFISFHTVDSFKYFFLFRRLCLFPCVIVNRIQMFLYNTIAEITWTVGLWKCKNHVISAKECQDMLLKTSNKVQGLAFLLSAFLWNFFLCQDPLQGDVPPHFEQPCYVDWSPLDYFLSKMVHFCTMEYISSC